MACACTCLPAPTLTPAERDALAPVKRDARIRPLNAQWTDRGSRNAPSPETTAPKPHTFAENTAQGRSSLL